MPASPPSKTIADIATEPSRSQRLAVGAFSALLLGVVLGPIRQNRRAEKRDGFPLSYYPMFSTRRPATSAVHHFRGIDADGGFVTVPYTCAGIGGFNRRQIRRIAQEGRAEELCAQAAAEVATRDPLIAVRRLQLVKARYHLDDGSWTPRASPCT